MSKPVPTIDWSNIDVTNVPNEQVDKDEKLVLEDGDDELHGDDGNDLIKNCRLSVSGTTMRHKAAAIDHNQVPIVCQSS